MSIPNCNGQGIVILGNITTPGLYPAGYNSYWTPTPVRTTFAPIKRVHLCARHLKRAIRSTPCSNPPVRPKLRCALRFMPQAATLTESGWIQQLILDTSSPAEASKPGRLA